MKSSSKINGTIHFLWRAVDQHGNVLDVLVQSRRNALAAIKFFRRLLKGLRYVPRVLVTDKLASYGPAHHVLMPAVEHRQSKYLNQSGRERASASSAISMRGNRPHTPGHCGIAANLNGFRPDMYAELCLARKGSRIDRETLRDRSRTATAVRCRPPKAEFSRLTRGLPRIVAVPSYPHDIA
jgi:DDE domain